jgi:hypothetical protein
MKEREAQKEAPKKEKDREDSLTHTYLTNAILSGISNPDHVSADCALRPGEADIRRSCLTQRAPPAVTETRKNKRDEAAITSPRYT